MRKPIQAAIPARPARPRSRWAVSSPRTAPANGPMISPGSPKNKPAMVPMAAPCHGASRRAQAFHAERHRGHVHEVGGDRQDAESDDRAGADPHETIRPGRQQESREYQNGSRESREDDPREADDDEDDSERPDHQSMMRLGWPLPRPREGRRASLAGGGEAVSHLIAVSGLAHERIAVVPRRVEGLLDRPRADPAHQVQLRARLVVGARAARAAERLLADDRAGRLVVDVEVAGRVAQRRRRLDDRARDPARTPRRSARRATSRRRARASPPTSRRRRRRR